MRFSLSIFWAGLLCLVTSARAAVTVREGDTLYSLSRRWGVSVSELRRLNHLSGNAIAVGQPLKMGAGARSHPLKPPASKPAAKPTVKPAAKPQGAAQRYTVQKGDTLYSVSRRFGRSVSELQRANHLSGTEIALGRRLLIPAKVQPSKAKPPAQSQRQPRKAPPFGGQAALPLGSERRTVYSYVLVGKRDTFASLQAKSGLDKATFMRLNRLGKPQVTAGAHVLLPRQVMVQKPPAPLRPPAQLIRTLVGGVPVTLVKVDLRHRGVLVSPVLPRWGLGHAGETVLNLARRSGARAVINGSYFHPQTYAPAGDLVVHGRLLTDGRIPAALAITPDNRAVIGSVSGQSWRGMETVVASGPQIVRGGVAQQHYSGVFRDPAVFAYAQRSAVGLSSNRDLMLVTTNARLSVPQMARVMVGLGARDALLLDGGSSAALAWDGQPVKASGRIVAYGIGVYLDYQGRRFQRN